MEKKERYHSVIDCNEDFVIRDCDSGRTCRSLFDVKTLLNYQNREINRLTKMLYTTTKHADKLNEENNKLNKELKKCKQLQKQLAIEELEKSQKKWEEKDTLIEQLQAENKLLKVGTKGLDDLLKSQAKKIVEDIEKNFTEYLPLKDKTGAGFYSRLNTILKKYGDKNE